MFKKLLTVSMCLILASSLLTSCANKDNSSDVSVSDADSSSDENVSVDVSLVIDGEEVDTTDLVMCTIDGFDIPFEEFRYYWMMYYEQLKSLGYDFEGDPDTVLSLIKYNTIYDLSSRYALFGLGRENSVDYTVSTEDLQTAYMYQLMKYQSEDEYVAFLQDNYLTDTALQRILSSEIAWDNVYSGLFGEGGALRVDNDSVIEVFDSDEIARCVHVLIPFSACVKLSDEDMVGWEDASVKSRYDKLQKAYAALDDSEKKKVSEKSLELAKEVQAKAEAGEDFFSLIEQYNYDPGMEPDKDQSYSDIAGYYFTKDYNYVKEFIDATFALEENEISDVVTSESYGYHIILRLPVDKEYVNENIDSLADEYNEINSFKVFNEYLDSVDITYSDYFDKLTLDSIG